MRENIKNILSQMHRSYLLDIQPVIQAKCEIYNKALPEIVLKDGVIERTYIFGEIEKQRIKYLDYLASSIKASYIESAKSLINPTEKGK